MPRPFRTGIISDQHELQGGWCEKGTGSVYFELMVATANEFHETHWHFNLDFHPHKLVDHEKLVGQFC